MAKTDYLQKLIQIDSRYIYGLIGLITIIFVLSPVILPLPISKGTQMLYDFIENLPPGSVVVMSEEHTVGFWPECGPGAVAVWQHAFNRPLKLIFIAFIQDGAMMEHQALTTMINTGNKKYGEDWVEIGFVAGAETGVAAFAKDLTMPKVDYYGNSLESLPIFQQAKTANDLSLWVVTGSVGNYYVLGQVNAVYGTPQATVTMAAQEAIYLPYLASGQFVGMINSVRGGAEYENLLKQPGFGNQMMGTITIVTGAIFGLVIFGNIITWVQKRGNK